MDEGRSIVHSFLNQDYAEEDEKDEFKVFLLVPRLCLGMQAWWLCHLCTIRGGRATKKCIPRQSLGTS